MTLSSIIRLSSVVEPKVIRFCWLIARMGRMVDVAYGGVFELR